MSNAEETKLSVSRILLAAIGVVALGGLAVMGFRMYQADAHAEEVPPWFAGYVDVTATPTYAFEAGAAAVPGEPLPPEDPEDEHVSSGGEAHDIVLSFIVAASDGSCTPTWGTAYTMEEAGHSLDLDRRIARLREQGGDIVVSFGGAINNELATVCSSPEELAGAYGAVVERYDLDTIDLDIEGPALQDQESIELRAEAVAELQAELRGQGEPLAVWLTLPVLPTGLTSESIDVVAAMLDAGVDLAGVNVMTMNYGQSRDSMSMVDASTMALRSTHRQLGILYDQAEMPLSDSKLWTKIGATPMIGQNDVAGEVFTLDDARELNEFAVETGVGRMSFWSLNRDITCGPNYPDTSRVSDACSGIDQGETTFAELLSSGFTGKAAEAAEEVTTPEPESAAPVEDDPETSPYPIWHEDASYLEGTKVVWRGNVYEAKWWTKGDLPDDPVLELWDTPWTLIGPVLEGEEPLPVPTLPKGTYEQWSGTEIYEQGDRVLLDEIPYEAKWWTQGDSPEVAAIDPDGSPWHPLTAEEVEEVLAELEE